MGQCSVSVTSSSTLPYAITVISVSATAGSITKQCNQATLQRFIHLVHRQSQHIQASTVLNLSAKLCQEPAHIQPLGVTVVRWAVECVCELSRRGGT